MIATEHTYTHTHKAQGAKLQNKTGSELKEGQTIQRKMKPGREKLQIMAEPGSNYKAYDTFNGSSRIKITSNSTNFIYIAPSNNNSGLKVLWWPPIYLPIRLKFWHLSKVVVWWPFEQVPGFSKCRHLSSSRRRSPWLSYDAPTAETRRKKLKYSGC